MIQMGFGFPVTVGKEYFLLVLVLPEFEVEATFERSDGLFAFFKEFPEVFRLV